MQEKKVSITVSNCTYYRGGGKGWNSKPFRLRKFQNISWEVPIEMYNKLTEKELLEYLDGRMYVSNGGGNFSPVWVTSTSKIKII